MSPGCVENPLELFCHMRKQASNTQNYQDGDDEVLVKLDQGGEELTVPRDSIYQVINNSLLTWQVLVRTCQQLPFDSLNIWFRLKAVLISFTLL